MLRRRNVEKGCSSRSASNGRAAQTPGPADSPYGMRLRAGAHSTILHCIECRVLLHCIECRVSSVRISLYCIVCLIVHVKSRIASVALLFPLAQSCGNVLGNSPFLESLVTRNGYEPTLALRRSCSWRSEAIVPGEVFSAADARVALVDVVPFGGMVCVVPFGGIVPELTLGASLFA